MTERIIFLDIDGPVIPEGCYYIDTSASFDRIFSNTCIGYLKKLLTLADAKLFTNSMHNFYTRTNDAGEKLGDLRDDLVNAGIPLELFHPNWRTEFGHNRYRSQSYRVDEPHPRLKAINGWIQSYTDGDIEWIGFDDDNYNHPNLLLVDFTDGITHKLFSEACDRFNVKKPLILA